MATDDLSKSHGTEARLKKAQLEIQQKFEQEKRNLEQQTARFAKRQALTKRFKFSLQKKPGPLHPLHLLHLRQRQQLDGRIFVPSVQGRNLRFQIHIEYLYIYKNTYISRVHMHAEYVTRVLNTAS